MYPGTLSISLPVRRLVAVLALVALAWSLAVLSGSAVLGDPAVTPTQPDQLLAPFRWAPLSTRLA
jgi:hypothetical protein